MNLFVYEIKGQHSSKCMLFCKKVLYNSRQMFKSLISCIFSQPNWPITIQGSHHTCFPELNLGPFCMLIDHLVWGKRGLIRGLKDLAAIPVYKKSSTRFLKKLRKFSTGFWDLRKPTSSYTLKFHFSRELMVLLFNLYRESGRNFNIGQKSFPTKTHALGICCI